ncbi:MAG TPA: cupin domain-containing protein, partial [Solirubrobacteraceae bacterium]|nr:cupin domain-containing protein [Solirubrobacteraceae bacterium]
MTQSDPATHRFHGDGSIPNSRLPVLVYRDVDAAAGPASAEQAFAANGWLGAWRNGIFSFHHFHSTAHEVLAIVSGSVRVTLGGPQGTTFEASRGDVLVLPAGTGHRNEGASGDLLVVGAYPDAMEWDVRRGDPAEYDEVQA